MSPINALEAASQPRRILLRRAEQGTRIPGLDFGKRPKILARIDAMCVRVMRMRQAFLSARI